MKPVDAERMGKLLGMMRESVGVLRRLSALPESDFLGDVHKQGSAKYHFIVAIEAAIDAANHLISRRGFRSPGDYADTFRVLAENGILTAAFAGELEKMARFRNRPVHIYWNVDVGEVRRILQSRLGDFDEYIRQIGAHLGSSSTTG
jgi:uncharacterized protein YutE (UPF0331/DUF86 family)